MRVKQGRAVVTSGQKQPYKIVLEHEDGAISEHPVRTVREGGRTDQASSVATAFSLAGEAAAEAPPNRSIMSSLDRYQAAMTRLDEASGLLGMHLLEQGRSPAAPPARR